jgi:DNA (cytosine-5)-methyltransferase 1
MYKTAHDHKSSLILTALSEVDSRRPDYAFFENVPGFLSYNPGAQQASRHTVEGGLQMGGLKLLIRVLIEMK